MSAPAKRLLKTEDLCSLRVITSTAVSPDEKQVAYTIETISDDQRKYFSHLYVVDCVTGDSRQYTCGETSDRNPTWSPDGRYIAFVSTKNKKSGIFVMSTTGGGARKVIEQEGTFLGIHWTPDSKEIVYNLRLHDDYREKDKSKKKEAPLFRHITELPFRFDGVGFLPEEKFHIWKVSLDDKKATRLTRGRYDNFLGSVSPNGKWAAYISRRVKNPDRDWLKFSLLVVPLAGGKERIIPTPEGPCLCPAFSPDSKTIAYLGHADPQSSLGVTNTHVWSVGVDGKPPARDLTSEFDRTAMDMTGGDIGEGLVLRAPSWSADGKRIYFLATDTGNTHLFFVPSKGGRPVRVTSRPCHVRAFDLNGPKRKIAAVVSDLKTPTGLHLIPAVASGDSRTRVLVDSNTDMLSRIRLPRVREVWLRADDGTRVQGWLVTPPNMNRNHKYPAILQIHGGPVVQWGFTFFYEMLLLASKGYVVLYTNPRGSSGRGEAFAGSINREWGTIDYYSDCMKAADYLEKLSYVDARRMGVTGGSYGGFMTNWIIGHTNRFRAAIAQRSLADMRSQIGTSDSGYGARRNFGAFPWDAPDYYRRISPLTYAKNVRTPLLIIHSENDLRANIEQAEQWFTTLKLMGKKVEFVRFPEEPHGLSRHGRPDRRIARLEWIIKWFDRWLKK